MAATRCGDTLTQNGAMFKPALLTVAVGLLLGCSRQGAIEVQAGQCWPRMSAGQEIVGQAKAYISAHVVTVESGCPHDVVIVIDGHSLLASEYDHFKRQSEANPDVVGFLFPVRFAGRLEDGRNGFSLRVSSIRRTGQIEIRKISELQRRT